MEFSLFVVFCCWLVCKTIQQTLSSLRYRWELKKRLDRYLGSI